MMHSQTAKGAKTRKSSHGKSKKSILGPGKRQTYVKSTLREIREKRLSFDATIKGDFPQRTPSRPLSPEGPQNKKETVVFRDRPTLSLTKLDFELLREWNWKERQKRLETWGYDLGLTKTHKHFQRPDRRGEVADRKRSGHGRKSKKDTTSGGILKKELEHLTGLRVYAPGETAAPTSRGRRRSILKNTGFLPAIGSRRNSDNGSIEQPRHHPVFNVVKEPTPLRNIQQQVRKSKFNNLMKQATEVLEAKKTFGKTWNAGTAASAAEKMSKAKRPSPTQMAATAERSLDLESDSSEGTTRRRHTHAHRHSHRHQSHSAHHFATLATGVVPPTDHTHSHSHTHIHHSRYRTDIEEEQPSTSYTSRKSTRGATTGQGKSSMSSRRSSSPSTPSDSAQSIGLNDLFRGLRKSLDDDKSEEGDEVKEQADKPVKKYERPNQPVEYQDTCFGGIKFVDRSAVKPLTKVNKDFEFYMTFDDTQLGLGMGRTKPVKVKFLRNTDIGGGRSKKILERKAAEKAKRAQERKERKLKQEMVAIEGEDATAVDQEPGPGSGHNHIMSFGELTGTGLLDFTTESGKTRAEKMMNFEKALMDLPGISSRWHIEVSAASTRPSNEINAVNRIPKRSQFTRPPRRIWYTPLPLTIKKYYRTNWKKIRLDIRKLMKDKQFWPKLWINFEESHPKKLYDLIRAKIAVKDFDKYGFKRIFDWGRGVHPDYIDWIIEDIVPHPGRYYYKDEEEQEPEAVRRASIEESDFRLKEWFVKPPRYIPDTPLSPPFDQYDFCGYGNREKPFFLAFTLPREILHYYAPPSSIQKFFRNIPKPPYAFPGYTFKRWLKYPLEQKLPQYYPFPQRFMTWTKGKVGEPVQCNSKNFYTDDPYFKKRDIAYSPYHDSHTRKYILRKDVLDRLWELGLINSKGEVKCSMAEFNKNRLYLRDYEWLEEATRRWDLQWNDRQQQNRLTKYTNFDDLDWEAKKMEWNMRLEKCKKNADIRDEQDQRKFRFIVERTKRSVEQAEKRKEALRQEAIERAMQRQKAQMIKRRTLYDFETLRKLQLQKIYRKKDMNAARHRKQHFLEKVADKLERQKERWERHVEFHRMRVAHVKSVEMALENDYRMRIKQHKRKVRAEWRDIPYAIIRKRERENYANRIALKYGRIWLEKVRERRKYLPDEAHISAWTHGRHLESTLSYLKDASGYMDFDTLFFSAFQKALHEQIELEEEEERRRQEGRPKTRRRKSAPSDKSEVDSQEEEDEEEDDEEEDDKSDDYLGSGENSDESDSENNKGDDNNSDGYEADEDDAVG